MKRAIWMLEERIEVFEIPSPSESLSEMQVEARFQRDQSFLKGIKKKMALT